MTVSNFFPVHEQGGVCILRLQSPDGTNRLVRESVRELTSFLQELAAKMQPVVITGNERCFSAGAELAEIAALDGPAAYEFSKMGQELLQRIDEFPAPVYAAISGYCMGGGLDLALACRYRIASPNAVFGHRGAALGLITGWGGTQRLPRLIGKAKGLGDVHGRRKSWFATSAADWAGGCNRERSRGRSHAADHFCRNPAECASCCASSLAFARLRLAGIP